MFLGPSSLCCLYLSIDVYVTVRTGSRTRMVVALAKPASFHPSMAAKKVSLTGHIASCPCYPDETLIGSDYLVDKHAPRAIVGSGQWVASSVS
jgi:hypothetical protein